MSGRSLYVTGTDTGVGKTLASAALLHALRGRGLRAVGMKPVASGCVQTGDGWRNDDALALQAASDPAPLYADVNPHALPLPVAPQFAAQAAGVELALAPILAAHARLASQADAVVVEGVGGWSSPLSATLDQIDLVRALRLPVVLVVGLRLGCINHARLSARAIVDDGARLVGWIASELEPDLAYRDETIAYLSQQLPAPCLGRLPHRGSPDSALLDPAALAAALASHLDVATLLAREH